MKQASAGESYKLYKAWCVKIGIRPADFITWAQTTARIQPPVDSVRYDRVSVLPSGK